MQPDEKWYALVFTSGKAYPVGPYPSEALAQQRVKDSGCDYRRLARPRMERAAGEGAAGGR